MISSLTYFRNHLPEPLAIEVWEALFDSYYLADNEKYNQLQLRHSILRFCKP